ncbi:hypothetical protein IWW37_003838 [Coemansia sp. RSA 2050]|nr:hypothetical protein IWW37_003838 [Coemansia sp. RSA 2050]KAJ2731422.1 hypothetical protein IW152_004566 [Coemansia sp. BCRC 34962]
MSTKEQDSVLLTETTGPSVASMNTSPVGDGGEVISTSLALAATVVETVDAQAHSTNASHDIKESTGTQDNEGGGQEDVDNSVASAGIVADALKDVSLSDVPPPEPDVGTELPLSVSTPLPPNSAAEASTTNSAALLKDSDVLQSQGVHWAGQRSGESERTAFGPPSRGMASPVSPGSRSSSGPDIVQVSGSDDEMDQEEAFEEQQQRLFRAAEERRQQRERRAHSSISSEDIEVMRSGLSSAREHTAPSELRILNGAFPEGLRGSLYLVGPGRFEVSYNVQRELEQATRSYSFGHLMDALPLLTKISFDPTEKTIGHRSRLLAKQLSGRIQMEHGINTKVPGALYMSETNQTLLNKFIPKQAHYATPEGECCGQSIELFVPLQGSSQTVVCTNHVGALQNIDPVDLHPRAIVDFKDINGAFKGPFSCPHMQYDSNTREHFSVLQDVGFRSTTYSVVAISELQPEGYVVASFEAQASVLHSFAITQDYVIVPVYPYSVPVGGVTYRWSDSLLQTLTFDRSQPVVFYVISREYRRVQCMYQAPTFFGLHQINAVQEAATDSVSIDLITYEDDIILRQLQIKSLRQPSADFFIPSGQVRRYQLNRVALEATKFVEARGRPSLIPMAHSLVLRSEPVELARVNPIVASKPYTHLYGLGHVERLQGLTAHLTSTTMYNCIVKLNANDASAQPLVWSRKHCYPSEPVFVPRSDVEDNGYILSVFFDSMRIASCLVVLDASTFKELMIAQLPSPMPLSFGHAKFAI